MAELKIMTYNCRGLGTQEKRRDVVNFLKNLDFDIYLLQDTHLTERTAQFFDTIWRGKCYHSYGTYNSRGVSVALTVSRFTAAPPASVVALVEDIRVPAGVSTPHMH